VTLLAPERDERITRPDGTGLHVVTHGRGCPVVLIHGFTANSTIWGFVTEQLAAAPVRIHAVDLRGHGRSDPMRVPTTVHDLADDLAAVIEALDLRDAVLVGHSLGGMALQTLAARRPDLFAERVRGLLLVNTSANPMASRAARLMGAFLQSRALDLVGRVDRLRIAAARSAFPSPVPACRVEAQAAMRPPDLASRRNFVVNSVPDLAAGNATVTVPTTVLAGARDLVITLRATAALASSFVDARLRIVTDAGHLLPLERPEIVAAEILRLASESAIPARGDKRD
jgi:pimeloyl-ACP methyl ester carboxylesterase